jgi:hypothetical protein
MLYVLVGNRIIVRQQVATWLCRNHLFRQCSFNDIYKCPNSASGRMTWNYRIVCADTLTSNQYNILQRRGFSAIIIPSDIGLVTGVEECKFYKSLDDKIQQHEWNELNSF